MKQIRITPSDPRDSSQLLRLIIVAGVLAFVLFGLALILILGPFTDSEKNGGGTFKTGLPPRYAFSPIQVPSDVLPGEVRPLVSAGSGNIVFESDKVLVPPAMVSTELQAGNLVESEIKRWFDKSQGGEVHLPDRLQSELAAVAQAVKPPVVAIAPKFSNDLYENPSADYHLRAEFQNAERIPVAASDPNLGVIEPRMMETPWLAFDALVKDVSGLTDDKIQNASNGTEFFESANPTAVEYLRGRVFSRKGLLWMLRKTPLRKPVEMNGKIQDFAWFGILTYLRPGLHGEASWVNQSMAFTALSIPQSLETSALQAGQHPSNNDACANASIWIELDGVYFRRVYYGEPIEGLSLDHLKDLPEGSHETWTEEVLPWLVAPSVRVVEADWPDKATLKEVVDTFGEASTAFRSSGDMDVRRDRFDEAGYYLLLQSLQDPESPFQSLESTGMTFRSLLDASMRTRYRGAKIRVQGLLQEQYFAYVLPPNISGKRYVYRTFVLDALDPSEADESLQWYVDLLEPPVQFRGRARVQVDGYYYRSQEFAAKVGDGVRVLTYPLLLSTKLTDAQPPRDSVLSSIGPLTMILVVGSVCTIIVLMILSGQRDRRRREVFERETLRHVRERMQRARGKKETDHPQSGDSV